MILITILLYIFAFYYFSYLLWLWLQIWPKLLMDMQQTVLKAFIEKKEIKVNLKYNPRGKRQENK